MSSNRKLFNLMLSSQRKVFGLIIEGISDLTEWLSTISISLTITLAAIQLLKNFGVTLQIGNPVITYILSETSVMNYIMNIGFIAIGANFLVRTGFISTMAIDEVVILVRRFRSRVRIVQRLMGRLSITYTMITATFFSILDIEGETPTEAVLDDWDETVLGDMDYS